MAERPSDLLPCPWCGEPLGSVSVSEGSTFRWRKVDGCCTDGPEVRHDTLANDRVSAEADSRRRAIEAWNRRARTLDAAPSEPGAECWRRAIAESMGNPTQRVRDIIIDRIEQRAREIAQEDRTLDGRTHDGFPA